MPLKNDIEKFLTSWEQAKDENFTNHPMAQLFKNDIKSEFELFANNFNSSYEVKASVGAGNWANVPWISILNPEITKSTQEGIYPCFLFKADGSGFYLSLQQGTTNPKKIHGKKEAASMAQAIKSRMLKELPKLESWGQSTIDLEATTTLGSSYEEANIIAKYYPGENIPESNTLKSDLLYLLKQYDEIEKLKLHNKADINKRNDSSVTYEKYTLPTDLKEFNCTLVTSLLAKPFAILTGASGTGKTKQAKDLAKHFAKDADGSNYEVVAVGADWTDNRSTLGFVNYLTQEGEPIYQSTPIVNLLLRASKGLNTPYFLILDEMNLSHVERYFADFLSVMEQKDGQLKLHSEGEDLENSAIGKDPVPSELKYPTNLFVIGTVNIDETTYMFSPKVLDRANVIEYKVDKGELGNFLLDPQEPAEIAPAEAKQAEQFLALARVIRGEESSEIVKTLGKNQLDAVQKDVLSLFELMQARRFEFAFRTANEISRYLKVSRHLSSDSDEWDEKGWRVSLDEQILQKVLPKLHGSVGRVGKLIAELAHFAYNPEASKYNEVLSDVGGLGSNEGDAKAVYPQSLTKLKEMAETLREEQFVSFI